MDKKCCSAEAESHNVEEQTTCCSSNHSKPSEKTDCCSSNTINTVVKDECCNTSSVIKEENTEITNCCDSKESDKDSGIPVGCCSSSGNPLDLVNVDNGAGIKEEFRVYGMDCPACAVTIEKSLSTQQSIYGVNVNYSTGKMKVSSTEELNLNPSKNI